MSLANELPQRTGLAALTGWIGFSAGWFDRSSLPADVIDEEVTEVICFKLSLALNRALGGAPDMTFSARAHRAKVTRGMVLRQMWRVVTVTVDLACAMLRGESRHCETAWLNYCRRPSKARRARSCHSR